jgi:D-amino-acid dehydrogenase
MTSGKSVVIIGGGVIGLCAAHYALQTGHDVTILERGALGHDCCSLGNAGMVVPSHFIPLAAPGMIAYGLRQLGNPESPFALRPRLSTDLLRWGWEFWRASTPARVERAAPLLRDLNLMSRTLFEEMEDAADNEFGLVKRGLLELCKSEERLHEEAKVAERACHLGVPAQILTPAEAAALDPGVRMDVAGAVYFPKDCHLSPMRLIAALERRVQQAGGRLVYSAEVTGWRTGASRVHAAMTNAGEYPADEFVLAGGAWSAETVRGLALRLPMQAGKGYSVTLEKPRQLPEICSLLVEARVAVTPMGSALRFGGTMEIAGNDLSVNRRRVEGIFQSIPRYLPDFSADDFRGLPVWSGLRPCSPDGLPYIGRFGRYRNLVVATGHAMMGVSLAPVTGKLVGELLSDQPPSLDIALLSPDRFG